jgi:Type-IV b secretion system, inner-membrane complex component
VIVPHDFRRNERLLNCSKYLSFLQFFLCIWFFLVISLKEPSSEWLMVANRQHKWTLKPAYLTNRPMIQREYLLNWAAAAAVSLYTYDASSVKQKLENLKYDLFVPDGQQAFQDTIVKMRLVRSVMLSQLVVTAVPLGYPVLLKQGFIFGEYTWRIQVPIQVQYQDSSRTSFKKFLVDLTIVLTSPDVLPRCFGIKSLRFIS